MTRSEQKSDEKEITLFFLHSYFPKTDKILLTSPDDTSNDKIDVHATNKSSQEEFNFQIKEVPFDPNEKTKKDFNNEFNFKHLEKMKAYNLPHPNWLSAVLCKIKECSDQYIEVKEKLDLLLLINDGAFLDIQVHDLKQINLLDYGFRSISCIIYAANYSINLYANNLAPLTLQKNQFIKKNYPFK